MAARRRRAGTRKTAGVKQAALKRAGLLAHNRRLGAAVSARQSTPKQAMGFNEARIQRVRRRGRIANPRTAVHRARGRELAGNEHRQGLRLTAIRSKLIPLSAGARRYKRDSRGRFSR